MYTSDMWVVLFLIVSIFCLVVYVVVFWSVGVWVFCVVVVVVFCWGGGGGFGGAVDLFVILGILILGFF